MLPFSYRLQRFFRTARLAVDAPLLPRSGDWPTKHRTIALSAACLLAFADVGLAAGVELDFERVPGSRDFDVSFAAAGRGPDEVSVRVSHGKAGPVAVRDGRLVARIAPGRTGRIEVTVESQSQGIEGTRTALVLGHVSDDWDQPEPVPGLVNTAAWEDGAAMSADGLWLVVQYFPVAFDCIASGKPDSRLCRTALGPVAAPLRPDMPGASRIDSRGRVTHACPSVGVAPLSFPLPPTSLYLFRRQADGSFGSPSPIYWDGVDGCVTPNGPALRTQGENDLILLFSFDTPSDSGGEDTHGDLFAIRIDPRVRLAVGRTVSKDGKLTDAEQQGTRVGRQSTLNTANPEGWTRPDGGLVAFYDDENVRNDLFYVESDKGWLDGQWGEEQRIPAPVSTPRAEESQPFFDGKALYFRRETSIYRSRYQGGRMSERAAWAEPEKVLDGERRANRDGEIMGTGEPTIATFDGRRELYFVFAERSPDGSLNLDVGRVVERNGVPAAEVAATQPGAGVELPIGSMQGIQGARATGMRTGIEGAAGGQALVWDYTVKSNADALLLMAGPEIPASSETIALSAHAGEETTLGLMVSERGGARYAVQVPWPAGTWQTRTFKWTDFQFQSHGNADTSGRLEPEDIEALLVIDASGSQGKSGDRTLQIDSLAIDTAQ